MMIRSLLALPFVAVFLLVGFLNAYVFVIGSILKKKAPSWIPIFGGICGTIGFLAAPVPQLNRMWFVPLLLDWGCLPGMLYAAWWHTIRIKHEKRTS